MNVRFRLRAARGALAGLAGADAAVAEALAGGRPRRFAGAPSASIARFSLSRSAIKSATICSVGILKIVARWFYAGKAICCAARSPSNIPVITYKMF